MVPLENPSHATHFLIENENADANKLRGPLPPPQRQLRFLFEASGAKGWVGLGIMCHPPVPNGDQAGHELLVGSVGGWVPRGRPLNGRVTSGATSSGRCFPALVYTK